ncbi:helix-turn-helix transcriptional regulator [Arvimicrobium flavum]|uniref:helix-turn-helix transcriptional regulator n=1 Tax=Arvimicrobium flavum TaxID=3393320 RepID=UPI00237BA831|nr:helix-turn-helix transcriptional regulator [Mesorhizobium shangrilense]
MALPRTNLPENAPAGLHGAAPSIADLLRIGDSIASDIGASDFATFFIGAARERGRLTPALDSDYPAVSTQSTILSSSFGDEFVRHAVTSTQPSWWSGERESPATRAFETLGCARRTALGLPDVPGIAFPAYAEHGASGLIAFFGTDILLSDELTPDVHARCFRLFADMVRLGLGQVGPRPAVTQRELDCLKLTANGYTSEEIAVILGLSVHTANQYLTKVTLKLNALNRVHAVAKALRLGLIE